MQTAKPFVVCFSGLDPTGGAGIQADIETLHALGCHALPIVSSLTVQTTRNVLETRPSDPGLVRRQFDALIDSELDIAAIKLGLIDSPHVMRCISEIIRLCPTIPVVADPVLTAGGGFEFGGDSLVQLYRELILPYCRVLTPNIPELKKLSPQTGSEYEALQALCATGCEYILLTGAHRDSEQVINRLYSSISPAIDHQWQWPRLAGEYHGSGCTLASAMAAGLAAGMSYTTAAERAQQFTWQALKNALKTGNGQYLPDRRNHL
ncbi:MAG: hydroxymethylpyrimidine/phosphomethylpyrimidine kinase [Pseudohongiella sp.]|nr:hydroxymethylpyrimidine/phosphomethylpyrimidine kinase [Pseudohongiella sp.]